MTLEATNNESDDRPAKRPCLTGPDWGALELLHTTVDDGTDVYNTPLAVNAPARMDETSGTPGTAPISNLAANPTIPGLGTATEGNTVQESEVVVIEDRLVAGHSQPMEDLPNAASVSPIVERSVDIRGAQNFENGLDRGRAGNEQWKDAPNGSTEVNGQDSIMQGDDTTEQRATQDVQTWQKSNRPEHDNHATVDEVMADRDILCSDAQALKKSLNTPPDLLNAVTTEVQGKDAAVGKSPVQEMPESNAGSSLDGYQISEEAGSASASLPSVVTTEEHHHARAVVHQTLDVYMTDVKAEPFSTESQILHTPPLDTANATASGPTSGSTGVLEDTSPTPGLENAEWEADSAPYGSSSSDTSSTSSSYESSSGGDDDDDYQLLDPEEQVRILMQEERGSDDEGQGDSSKSKDPTAGPSRICTTNEQTEAVIPTPNISLTCDSKITSLGVVESVVENTVLIKASAAGYYQVLESGSVLCLSDKSIIGVVAETLGRVQQPLYTVRFSDAATISEKGLAEKGKEVFYVDEHSTFVFTQALKAVKGSDASNIHDEEVAEHEVEFSDDEMEAEYKRQLKMKRKGRKDDRGNGFTKPPRKGLGRQNGYGHAGDAESEISYGDVGSTMEEDYNEGYTPLARPSNLHEMMGSKEAPEEGWDPSHRSPSFSNGECGRGSHRGGLLRGRGRDGQHRGRRGGKGRDRGRFDNRRNDHGGNGSQQHHDHRRPSFPADQPSYSPNPSQYGSPHASNQSPGFNMPPPPSPYSGHSNQQQPYQSQSPQPFYPQMLSPPLHYTQSQISAFSPFQPQSYHPHSQPPTYTQPPPGSHINPAFYTAVQQHQQPTNLSHGNYQPSLTQSQSHSTPQGQAHSPNQNVDLARAKVLGSQQGSKTDAGGMNAAGSTGDGGPGRGISEILRRLGSGS